MVSFCLPSVVAHLSFTLKHLRYLFQEMGFSQEQAESALKRFGSVQQALDSLLAGVGKDLRLRSHGNSKSSKGTPVITLVLTLCSCCGCAIS